MKSVSMAANSTKSSARNIVRRSLNSGPSIWHFNYVQSIKNEYHQKGEEYAHEVNRLKDKVRTKLKKVNDPLVQLEQIDLLLRFGISYHFKDEINYVLKGIHSNYDSGSDIMWEDNLYATALKFRLLRQYQYSIPQEVFGVFKDERGNFKQSISNDVMGMLSMYEASFYLVQGEVILEEAREFATKHLQNFLKHNKLDGNDKNNYILELVSHALEVPLHWRAPRLEARWFIDLCRTARVHNIDAALLDLAILDFNAVQSIHQEELQDLYRWWKQTSLGEKMTFSRDRLPESFLWAMGMVHQPQLGYCRQMSTKIFALLTIIDDVYDVYGALDELEVFTDAFERWDVNAIDDLPYNMKICFLAVYNFTNEVVYDVLKEQEVHVIKYLRKAWADLSKAYLLEAKWHYTRYTPCFQEYIENAWISIAAPTCLVLAYFCVTNPITQEALEFWEEYPSIIRQSSLICRLTNDLSTSHIELKRGDAAPSSIQCYMQETGASEDDAREHLKFRIDEAWKQMNKDRVTSSPFSDTLVELIINLARITMWMYQDRDGFGVQNQCITKETALLLFVNNIPLRM